jgi:muconolactone delta-isomerase
MQKFMATILLPETLTEEFISLIPQQRFVVNRLVEKNIILNYSLSADRSKLWIVFNAKDEDHVRRVIQRFPLFKFMKVNIDELAFVESKALRFPELMWN